MAQKPESEAPRKVSKVLSNNLKSLKFMQRAVPARQQDDAIDVAHALLATGEHTPVVMPQR